MDRLVTRRLRHLADGQGGVAQQLPGALEPGGEDELLRRLADRLAEQVTMSIALSLDIPY